MVLAGLERAEHHVLARFTPGLFQALRLCNQWGTPCVADRESRRPAYGRRPRWKISRAVSRTLCARHELLHGKNWFAARLRWVPRERFTGVHKWPCAHKHGSTIAEH